VLLCLAFESRDHAQAQSNPLAEPAPKNPSNGSAEKVTPRHLTPRPDNPQDAEILHWIEQLGSDSFSERLEAQGRLERFGLDALDLLRSATEHSDPQIAAQARFMVQSGRFANVTTTAPFELRKLLELFDTSDTDGKISQIQSLNRLDNYLGVRHFAVSLVSNAIHKSQNSLPWN
jgi:hypothetical protein